VNLALLDQLPADAVTKRVHSVRKPLERVRCAMGALSDLPQHVPLTEAGWQASLRDADLSGAWSEIDSAGQNLLTAARDDGSVVRRGLPRAAWRLAQSFEVFSERSAALGWFGPADSTTARAARHAIDAVGVFVVELLVGIGEPDRRPALESALADALQALGRLRELADKPAPTFDPVAAVEAAFGPAERTLTAARGRLSTSRLLAAHYRTRLEELRARASELVSHLGVEAQPYWASVWAAEQLVSAPRPLLAHLTAARLVEVIRAAESANPVRATAPLRTIGSRINRFEESDRRAGEALDGLAGARSARDAARYTLIAYEAVAEGQLRWWGWALARLLGHAESERAPELGTVRQTLAGSDHPLAADIAAVLEPRWRNLLDHHDFEFDHAAGVIVDDTSELEPSVVEDALTRARSLVAGLRAGRVIALATLPQLKQRLVGDDEIGIYAAGREQLIEWRLGASGLWVEDLIRDRQTLRVELDELPFDAINPCLQVLSVLPKFDEEIERLQIVVAGISRPVIDVPRPVLDATFVLYQRALSSFQAMPPATFMPTLAWARLEVEPPEQSAAAAAWLLANETVNLLAETLTEAARGSRSARRELWLHLDLLASSAVTTFAVLPDGSARAQDPLLDVLRDAVQLAHRLADGDSTVAAQLALILQLLGEELERTSAVAVLPTLDPRPLGES
jgi:hypothetical protein